MEWEGGKCPVGVGVGFFKKSLCRGSLSLSLLLQSGVSQVAVGLAVVSYLNGSLDFGGLCGFVVLPPSFLNPLLSMLCLERNISSFREWREKERRRKKTAFSFSLFP